MISRLNYRSLGLLSVVVLLVVACTGAAATPAAALTPPQSHALLSIWSVVHGFAHPFTKPAEEKPKNLPGPSLSASAGLAPCEPRDGGGQ